MDLQKEAIPARKFDDTVGKILEKLYESLTQFRKPTQKKADRELLLY